jgi:hypothetical protein
MGPGTEQDPPASPAPTRSDLNRPGGAAGHPEDRQTHYFVHVVDGHTYGAWYTRLPDGRVEVFTRTKIRTRLLGKLSIEDEARRVLEQMVRDSADGLFDSELLPMTRSPP